MIKEISHATKTLEDDALLEFYRSNIFGDEANEEFKTEIEIRGLVVPRQNE